MVKSLNDYLGKPTINLNEKTSLRNTHIFVTADPDGFATSVTHWLNESTQVDLISLRTKSCLI